MKLLQDIFDKTLNDEINWSNYPKFNKQTNKLVKWNLFGDIKMDNDLWYGFTEDDELQAWFDEMELEHKQVMENTDRSEEWNI